MSRLSPAAADVGRDYESAINALNQLQSNTAYLTFAKRHRDTLTARSQSDARAYLAAVRAGDAPNPLAPPPVLHVSGTKGKGSTCAFAEALLRARRLRTGLFTSPHLVQVRERIRLDGTPLSKAMFARYFWLVHDRLAAYQRVNCAAAGVSPDDHDALTRLELTAESLWPVPLRMPGYFRFLTVMAQHVFAAERVDVAVLEVGIGGRFDCTNAADGRKLAAIVTSLGIDHVALLGDSVEAIAWHKAGIMRQACPAVTCEQPGAAGDVLAAEADSVGCALWRSPPLESYSTPDGAPLRLGIQGEVQRVNASLALQAVRFCVEGLGLACPGSAGAALSNGVNGLQPREATGWQLSTNEVAALSGVSWPGRHQIIERCSGQLRFFLDGAHTPESMAHTVRWFETSSSGARRRLLLYNMTGERQADVMLSLLAGAGSGRLWSSAIFCPNVVYASESNSALTRDLMYRQPQAAGTEARSVALAELWSTLVQKQQQQSGLGSQQQLVYYVCLSVEEALAYIESGAGERPQQEASSSGDSNGNGGYDVLVTGSLHLIGCALKLLQPEIWQ